MQRTAAAGGGERAAWAGRPVAAAAAAAIAAAVAGAGGDLHEREFDVGGLLCACLDKGHSELLGEGGGGAVVDLLLVYQVVLVPDLLQSRVGQAVAIGMAKEAV